MKKILLIAALLLLSLATFAQSGKAFYRKYSNEPGVSAVYISPFMFKMIGALPMETSSGDVDLAPIIKNLSGMYILDSENPEVSKKLNREIDKVLSAGNFELMMEAKDDGDIVQMYTDGDVDTVTSFILVSIEPDEFTIIWIDGKMAREELENLLSETIEVN